MSGAADDKSQTSGQGSESRLSDFEAWIKKERRWTTAKQSINWVRKFHNVLDSGDASPLLQLTPKNRQHAMRALSSLSKYQGRYPLWQEIIKRHQLSWSVGTDSFNARWIEEMIDGTNQMPEMLQWLREATGKLPAPYCNALLANVMTGLRVEESFECLKLIRSDKQNYVKQKGSLYLILHYKHPEIFFRPTKKAFLSILTEPAMKLLESTEPVNSNALRLAQNHRKLPARSKWARKIHNNVTKEAGLSEEQVNVLAGRVPLGVFQRHYAKQGLDYAKIEHAVNELWQAVQPLVKN